MFEFLYLGQVIDLVDKHPKEALAAIVAITAGSSLSHIRAEKIKAEKEIKVAEIRRECELIRLETAKFEAQNRSSN